jgi:hypothetical protein
MRHRFHPWLLLLALIVVCSAVIGLVALLRYRGTADQAGLLSRLPTENAFVLYLDFDALRKAGMLNLLDRSKVPEEPEYKSFVAESGFDYREDLDSALVSFRPDGVFMLLRGRFNWKALSGYVQAQGGTCLNAFCRTIGSTPDRHISFFPLRPGVMGLAVSKDDWAATNLTVKRPKLDTAAIPKQPVWLWVPSGRLADVDNLPAGTRQFAKAMQGAEKIVLSVGPRGDGYEAVLDVTTRSVPDASTLVSHLEGITSFLKKMIAEEKRSPNPQDLSGVLTAGVFERQDRRVVGRWPLERAFLEALASGSL